MSETLDPAVSAPSRRRSWLRLRFSLRTLVLTSLLIGSGTTLWLHWQSWYVLRVLDEQPAPIEQLGFLPGSLNTFVVTHIENPKSTNLWDRYEDQIAIFDKNGCLIQLLKGGSGYGYIWFSPLGSFLQLVSFHRNAKYWKCAWNLQTGKMVEALGRQSPELSVLSFSPDERFAIVNLKDEAPGVVSIPGGELVAKLPGLSSAVFSHQSGRLAIPTADGTLIYDTQTWNMVSTLGKGRSSTGAQFSPDDRLAASFRVGDESEETIIYDVKVEAELFKFEGGITGVTGFSPDGRFITTVSPSHTQVYELTRGRVIVKDAQPGFTIRYSTDGKRIFAESGVWSADTGELLWKPEDYASPFKYAADYKIYSNDGKYVIFKAEETILLASAETGKSLFEFPHLDWPNDLHRAISPDSTQILTAPVGRVRPANRIPPHDPTTQATVWQRRRPEYWWGFAWLPEFWLTGLFSSLLVWSVWRDRKRIA